MQLNDKLYSKLKYILCKHLKIDEDIDETEIEQDIIESWTSSKHLSMIMEVENEFKVRFTINEIVEMTSYEAFASCIGSKI